MWIVNSNSSQFFTLNVNLGCFSLCQTDRSVISGNAREKWNIFRSNRAHQQEWFLTIPSMSKEEKEGNEPVCKNGKANFGLNRWTGQSGPHPEVVSNILVERNRKEPFYWTCDRNLWNLWHNGKHPTLQPWFVCIQGILNFFSSAVYKVRNRFRFCLILFGFLYYFFLT